MVKLQACDELREERHATSRKVLMHIEDVLPLALEMEARERVKLADKIEAEISSSSQSVLRGAFKAVRMDWEELQALRKSSGEVEERVARMNGNYLREISTNRDRLRPGLATVKGVLEEVEQGSCVEFYEPLQFLSEEVRRTAMGVIEEKLKAIFAFDPTLRERTNAQELARFEDSMLRERCEALERLNGSLRDEARELRASLRKLEQEQERRHNMSLDWRKAAQRAQAEVATLRKQCNESPRAAEEAAQNAAAEATQATKLSAVSAEDTEEATPHSCDAAVQTTPDERQSRTEAFVLQDGGGSNLANDKEALLDQMSKARHELSLARILLRKREAEIKELKEDAAKVPVSPSAASTVDSPSRTQSADGYDVEQLRCELMAAREGEQAAQEEAERMREDSAQVQSEIGKLQEMLEHTQEEVARMQSALQVSSDLRQRLQEELEHARDAAASSDKRRKQQLMESVLETHTPGMQLIASELEEEMENSDHLRSEVERLQAMMTLIVSRNDALTAALAAATGCADSPSPSQDAGSLSPAAQMLAASREHKECRMMKDQRAELRESLHCKKAQLQVLLRENQVMQLALDAMQQDIQALTRQLRRFMPEKEVISEDLEAVLSKFDKVARNGGGAYIRLNKEARLREVAAEAREKSEKKEAEEAFKEEIYYCSTGSSGNERSSLPAASPRTATMKSLQQLVTPRALQTPAATVVFPSFQPSEDKSKAGRTPATPLRAPGAPGAPVVARSISHGRPSNPESVAEVQMQKRNSRKTSIGSVGAVLPLATPTSGNGEKRGSLTFGTRGGMAIFGSPRFRTA